MEVSVQAQSGPMEQSRAENMGFLKGDKRSSGLVFIDQVIRGIGPRACG
jgi:hypothetical protein